MFSIQQLIKALQRLQNNTNGTNSGNLAKTIKYVAATTAPSSNEEAATSSKTADKANMTSPMTNSANENELELERQNKNTIIMTSTTKQQQQLINNANDTSQLLFKQILQQLEEQQQQTEQNSSRQQHFCPNSTHSQNDCFSFHLPLNENGSSQNIPSENSQELNNIIHKKSASTQDYNLKQQTPVIVSATAIQQPPRHQQYKYQQHLEQHSFTSTYSAFYHLHRIHNLFVRNQNFHINYFHTQQNLNGKQKQTQFAMSSLAAEALAPTSSALPLTDDNIAGNYNTTSNESPAEKSSESSSAADTTAAATATSSASEKPCFSTGFGDILQFMELIGNLKHTKRTGWVLRDVNDCESISGHMYRMSMLTFLLDGTEGLNQIRCMELALVHDLAESVVGDLTPFCGVSKDDKRNMEFKAMEDICKLIEPRGKRIMELFVEYEHGESPESKFVKDLDRLDMVMQAFEYEKRDNCLLKHQEFFDSTAGKFNHPFVKNLVKEIYEQREKMAKAKGATPPPKIEVPNMEAGAHSSSSPSSSSHDSDTKQNGHCNGNCSSKSS